MSARSDHESLSSPLLSSPPVSRASTPPLSSMPQGSGPPLPNVSSPQQGTRSRSGSLSQGMGAQVGVQQTEQARSRSSSFSGGVSQPPPHVSVPMPSLANASPSTELSPLVSRARAQTSPSGSRLTTGARVMGHVSDFGAALSSMPVQGGVGPVQGVISGGLWAASAVSGGIADARSDNTTGMVSDLFGFAAGGVSALASGVSNTALSYMSSASWLVSGGISTVQGAYGALSSGRNRGANALQAASGALNMLGAAASGASTYFSAQASAQDPGNQDSTNAHLATTMAWVSMGSWTLGSLAGMGSSYLSARGGTAEPQSGGGSQV